MPKVEDIFSQLNGEKYFSMLDLQAGYHHIPLAEASIPKTSLHQLESTSTSKYIGLKEDKLSSTTVDFIRSEGNLETKRLYWFSKPKMC